MTTVDTGPDPIDEARSGAPERSRGDGWAVVLPALVGAAVAVALGVYGRQHRPTGAALPTLGLSSVLEVKAVVASIVAGLGLFQMATALAMWQRLPGRRAPAGWLVAAHRWSGAAAFLCSLPVAYHCLWSLGLRDSEPRVLVHSLLGCGFYGAFTTKLLVLRTPRVPSWAVPVIGGLVLALVISIWLTSALWFFAIAPRGAG
ncbi:MAG: hypothetical protein JWM47_368 [Acidimicrobiales bacterium]|nr:hypothetical protein [Acidimicrobiales bacterium]